MKIKNHIKNQEKSINKDKANAFMNKLINKLEINFTQHQKN